MKNCYITWYLGWPISKRPGWLSFLPNLSLHRLETYEGVHSTTSRRFTHPRSSAQTTEFIPQQLGCTLRPALRKTGASHGWVQWTTLDSCVQRKALTTLSAFPADCQCRTQKWKWRQRSMKAGLKFKRTAKEGWWHYVQLSEIRVIRWN